MRFRILLLLLLPCSTAFSQDTLITFGAKRYPVEIISKSGDSVKFRLTGKSKPKMFHKNWVSQIKYANGSSESFFTDAEKAVPLDTLKAKIIKTISAHAYEVDSKKQQYRPFFVGDYIQMPLYVGTKRDGGPGFLYNFAHVYEFQPISERNDTDAYINIMLDFQEKPNISKWKKQKLVLRVRGHKEAQEIFRLLQNYNRAMVEKQIVYKY